MSNTTHTFNIAAKETMDKSIAVCEQRAGEYMDSWSLENLKTPYLDSLVDLIEETEVLLSKNKVLKRLIMMAAMCDIKISRMSGPFKEDTYVDLNNYNSAFCSLRKLYELKLKMQDI